MTVAEPPDELHLTIQQTPGIDPAQPEACPVEGTFWGDHLTKYRKARRLTLRRHFLNNNPYNPFEPEDPGRSNRPEAQNQMTRWVKVGPTWQQSRYRRSP